jgi:hypothetical protein
MLIKGVRRKIFPRKDSDAQFYLSGGLAKEGSNIMLKIGFLIIAPSILTYFASTYFQSMESFFYIFVLSSAALLVAILSHIGAKSKS